MCVCNYDMMNEEQDDGVRLTEEEASLFAREAVERPWEGTLLQGGRLEVLHLSCVYVCVYVSMYVWNELQEDIEALS
jgi:hypothetical protein